MLYEIVVSVVAFFCALVILIAVHEFGHFWVARKCGVKVQRFSIGFGKILFKFHDKSGTEYAWSLIPLGGYVKMLDENIEPVPPELRPYAFNVQPLYKRTLIVMAGPAFNWLLAIVAFWAMLSIGMVQLIPIIGKVEPSSIAAQAGLQAHDKILQIGHVPMSNWQDIRVAFISHLGQKQLPVTVQRGRHEVTKTLNLKDWTMPVEEMDISHSLGLVPHLPPIPAEIGWVRPDGPAAEAGMKGGDKIIRVDGRLIKDWNDVSEYIKVRPLQKIVFEVARAQANGTVSTEKMTIIPHEVQSNYGNTKVGVIGVGPKPVAIPKEYTVLQAYPVWWAWWPAIKQTGEFTVLTFKMFGKLLTGQVSVKTMSGPIGIAVGAGQSASSGAQYYLGFIALISISLAVINVLPIPMLDGGYLLFYLIEWVRRKPLSRQVQMYAFKVGFVLILLLMSVAMYSDFTRYF